VRVKAMPLVKGGLHVGIKATLGAASRLALADR
jgi:hypothetical protein